MKLVETRPRYQCDFCNYQDIEHDVALHEGVCLGNPNRHCPLCDNADFVERTPMKDEWDILTENWHLVVEPCPFCYPRFSVFWNLPERENNKN
jgi:hypothetical protein